MNRTTLGLLAISALFSSIVASVSTLVALGLTSPQPVQAAPDKKELRIAIVNLEAVARATPKFARCKIEWDAAQDELKRQTQKMKRDYKLTLEKIQRALARNPEADVLELRVELQSIEQLMKVAEEEHRMYLGALLAEYQKLVLVDVYANLQRYVRQEGYNLVLQDYENAVDADFFSGAAYAQSMMSKPVLDAPWALDGDPHVTDITAVMIKFMRAGGVPEKDD
jgi:hypothetical protein